MGAQKGALTVEVGGEQVPAGGRAWTDFRIGYQPAFNGFRAVGITTFIVYHGQLLYGDGSTPAVFSGAFLWLDMFFVQSGFLITSLLIEEWYRTGRIGIGSFYIRRMLRLFPALLLVVAVVAVWLFTFAPVEWRDQGWREVWSTAFYVNNWVLIFGPRDPGLYLSHGWSLSVEEQFYLVAPIALLLMLGAAWRPRRVITVLLACAAVSSAWMVVLAQRGVDLVRIYYATDTRAQSFLIGAALAAAAAGGYVFRTRHARRAVRWLAWVSLPIVIWLLLAGHTTDRGMYDGWFTIASLCFAVLLAHLVQEPTSVVSRVLALKPLERTGRIAYGLYLWHWPIMLATYEWFRDGGISEPVAIALWLVLAFLFAGASWHFLEEPVLRYAERFRRVEPSLERTLGKPRAGRRLRGRRVALVVAGLLAVCGAVLAAALAVSPSKVEPTPLEERALAYEVLAREAPDGSVKTLVAGDALAFGMSRVPAPIDIGGLYGSTAAMLGCGIADGQVVVGGRVSPPRPCEFRWQDLYRSARRSFEPDVAVLMVGQSEVFDRMVDGRLLAFGSPELEAHLRAQLERAHRILTKDGAPLLLATVPCIEPAPTLPASWRAILRDPSRYEWVNRIRRDFAADHPDTVRIVELDDLLCEDGVPRDEVEGVEVRPDGANLTAEGARAVWRWLAPQARAARGD